MYERLSNLASISLRTSAVLTALGFCQYASGHDDKASGSHPYEHGPAGIMADHLHDADEFMIGYNYSFTRMSGLKAGSDSISQHEVAMAGFTMAPDSMDMHMHMLHLMYAPTDWLTLVAMPHYMEMDMEMTMLSGGMDGGGHGGHMAMDEDHGGGHEGTHSAGMHHSHGTEGIGDTVVGGLFSLWHHGNHQLIAQAGLSIPTGGVDYRGTDGKFTHYGMQIGSGTWDLLPGLTYTAHSGNISWGLQGELTLRIEEENESGYQLGNVAETTGWIACQLLPWASVSGRLNYRHEGNLTGHYNGPHNHSSPSDLQANYGGEVLEGGVGLNLVGRSGFLRGHRFGIEVMLPIHEDYNGIQMGLDYTVNFAWSKAF